MKMINEDALSIIIQAIKEVTKNDAVNTFLGSIEHMLKPEIPSREYEYHVFYSKSENDKGYRMYIVPDHYSHSMQYLNCVLNFAKSISTLPDDLNEITIEVLAGQRFKRMMSLEYYSSTLPTFKNQYELTPNSGLWDWLKY